MKKHISVIPLIVSSILILTACDEKSADNEVVSENAISILDGKASIVLPADYVRMPQNLLDAKYPMAEKRPSEAWYVESEGGKVTIAFSMTETKVPESEVYRLTKVLKMQMSMLSPSTSELKVNGKNMGRLEMTTPSSDGKIFNVMQISSMNDKMLISTFNVTEELKEKYTSEGKEALSTLKY